MSGRGLVSAVGGLQDATRHVYRHPAVCGRTDCLYLCLCTYMYLYLDLYLYLSLYLYLYFCTCICIASWLPTTYCVAVSRSQNIDGAILREADWICGENMWIKVTNIIIIRKRKNAPIFRDGHKRKDKGCCEKVLNGDDGVLRRGLFGTLATATRPSSGTSS